MGPPRRPEHSSVRKVAGGSHFRSCSVPSCHVSRFLLPDLGGGGGGEGEKWSIYISRAIDMKVAEEHKRILFLGSKGRFT